MHFRYSQEGGTFTVYADFREDHGDSVSGIRIQGDKTPLTLMERSVSFGLKVQEIDPDHFALAALLLFLPFVGSKVSFSVPVSDAIVKFLASGELKPFRQTPVSVVSRTTGRRRERSQRPVTLETSALALGGGFDAVALKVLLPDVFTYHILPVVIIDKIFHYPAYRFYAQQRDLEASGKPVCDAYIWSNMEAVVRPRGVTTWPFFAIPALLMAADKGINCVMSGTVFEASFCANGLKYYPYHKGLDTNFVIRVFRALDICLAPAATMLPEYLNIRTVINARLGDAVSYCIQGAAGGPCGKCLKCYRKKLLYEVYRGNGGGAVRQFDEMRNENFDNPYLRALSNKRPMYLSSSFKWLQPRVSDMLPFIRDAVRDLPDVRFDLGKVYEPGLEFLPAAIKTSLMEKLRDKYEFMGTDEMRALEQWDCFKSLGA